MTEPSASDTANPETPIWMRGWFGALAGVCFAGVVIVADSYHEGGTAEWAMIFALAQGLAAIVFWNKHGRWWFWPSMLLFAAIPVAMLMRWTWHVVPSPGAINLRGAIFAPAALECAWLWWMGWLFDPHAKPRTKASIQVEVILYAFVALFLMIGVLVWWGIERREEQVDRESRVVASGGSGSSVYDLEGCFFDGPHRDQVWMLLPAKPRAERMRDDVYHTSVTITDRGDDRLVEVTTLNGKPMPSKLAATYAECLAPH